MGSSFVRVTQFADPAHPPMVEMWTKVDAVECDTEPMYGYWRLGGPCGLTDDQWLEALRTSTSELYEPVQK